MKIKHSQHWKRKSILRKDLTDDLLSYAIEASQIFSDREYNNVLNAICRIPPMGRKIKVVYRRIGKDEVLMITAYWME